jgi:hypothetical protein
MKQELTVTQNSPEVNIIICACKLQYSLHLFISQFVLHVQQRILLALIQQIMLDEKYRWRVCYTCLIFHPYCLP